jgi:sugar phosphate isomerase/epimerase
MLTNRLAVAAGGLSRHFRDSLKIAHELGVDGVEIDGRRGLSADEMSRSGLRQIRKWLEDYGLGVSAVTFPTRRGYGDPEALEARITSTKSAMQMAYDLGARLLSLHVGEIPVSDESAEWKLLLEVLSDLGSWGDRVGTTIAVEAGRSDPEDLSRLFDALPAGSLACDLSTGLLVVHRHDPVEAIRELGRSVAYVHATDAIAGPIAGRGRAVVLGTGQVDFAEILGCLEEQAYHGWLSLEAVEPVAARREIENAAAFLRSIG